MKQDLPTPSQINPDLLHTIKVNLHKLYEANKTTLTQGKLVKTFEEEFHFSLKQGNLPKYLNNNSPDMPPLCLIIAFCKIYNVAIYDLINPDFDPNSLSSKDSAEPSNPPAPAASRLSLDLDSSRFVVNPRDPLFTAYLGQYWCYFFPTLSHEDELLTAELTLEDAASHCKATFCISLKNNHKKTYTGIAVISPSISALYILLQSSHEAELCMINLRHFSIRHQHLDCRIAEAITNGAGEHHFPTIHRMLISSQKLQPEDLKYIEPQLHLNTSNIYISKEELFQLKETSPEYSHLIDHLMQDITPTEIYAFKEDIIVTHANQFLSGESISSHLKKSQHFLYAIRSASLKSRYNKVSRKLDETVWKLLKKMGYFK